ncbi:hypothetical protein, partial [Deinococcus radiodurans]
MTPHIYPVARERPHFALGRSFNSAYGSRQRLECVVFGQTRSECREIPSQALFGGLKGYFSGWLLGVKSCLNKQRIGIRTGQTMVRAVLGGFKSE